MIPAFQKNILVFAITLCGMTLSTCINPMALKPSIPTGDGTVGSAVTLWGKCSALDDWVSKFTREYGSTTYTRGRDKNFANLFRETYFVPVFGEPYLHMTEDTKAKIKQEVIRGSFIESVF